MTWPVWIARRRRLVLRAAAIASVVAGAFTFVVAPLRGDFSGSLYDFHQYLGGASAAARHAGIYAVFEQQLQNPQFGGFDYPPVVAWLLEPLTWLPSTAAAIVWLWEMLACCVAGAVVLARTLLPSRWPRVELALLSTFAFAPVTFNLRLGQLEPLVFLLLAIACWAYVRERTLTFGIVVGAAAALKLAPLLLLVLVVRRGWWRAVAASVATVGIATGIGLVALGTGPLVDYMTRVVPALARQNGWLYNQSLDGLLNRVANHSVLSVQPSSSVLAACGVAAAFACVLTVAVVTRRDARGQSWRGMEFGVAVTAMLLVASITWYLHLMLLLIPFAAVAGWIAATKGSGSRGLALSLAFCALAAGLAGALLSDAPFVNALLSTHGSAAWWPMLQLSSLPALGVVALFATSAFSMLRRSGAYANRVRS